MREATFGPLVRVGDHSGPHARGFDIFSVPARGTDVLIAEPDPLPEDVHAMIVAAAS